MAVKKAQEQKEQTAKLEADKSRYLKSLTLLAEKLGINKPITKINDFLKLEKNIELDVIDQTGSNDLKTLSIEMLVGFLHSNIHSFEPVKKYIYSGRCKKPSEFDNSPLSKFNILSFFKTKAAMSRFSIFYKEFFRSSPGIYISKRVKGKFSKENADIVRSVWSQVKPSWDHFIEQYENEYIIPAEIREMVKLQCSVKDLMNFYTYLPRFYQVYKNPSPNVYTTPKYHTIGEIRDFWSPMMDKYFNRVHFMHLWVRLFKFLDYYISENPRDEFLVRFEELMINFAQAVTYSYQRFEFFSQNFKGIEGRLQSVILSLENKKKENQIKFPDFTALYNFGARAFVLAILVALFV